MYNSSGEKAVFVVVSRIGDLLVCQRVDEFRLPVIRYKILRMMLELQHGHMLQGDCLCGFGLVDASVGFRAFWSHLRFAGSHDRPIGQPCVGPTRFCICLQQCVETKQ